MKIPLLILLFYGCVKSPCVLTVDVEFKQGAEISATAIKKVKCGDYISFPFHTATKYDESIRFIEINFFQGQRVVRADVIFDFDFKNGVYNNEYDFPDTNPDLMIWKVYEVDRSGFVQYETIIK